MYMRCCIAMVRAATARLGWVDVETVNILVEVGL